MLHQAVVQAVVHRFIKLASADSKRSCAGGSSSNLNSNMPYCGCGTSSARLRWGLVVLFAAIFAALYIAVTVQAQTCEYCDVDNECVNLVSNNGQIASEAYGPNRELDGDSMPSANAAVQSVRFLNVRLLERCTKPLVNTQFINCAALS